MVVKKIENGVVSGFNNMTDKITNHFNNNEGKVVNEIGKKTTEGFDKISDKFVGTFLTKEGETVEEAKSRLAAEQKARDDAMKAEAEKHAAAQKAMIDASLEASKNAGKHI